MFNIVEFFPAGNSAIVFSCNTAREGYEVLRDMSETRPGLCAMLCDGDNNNRVIADIG